jgi:ubiquinone/menaquinone biosynthesis C-methylase UbiE
LSITRTASRFAYRLLTGDRRVSGRGNLATREVWLERALARIPAGRRILDAGAGELKYRKFCGHLDYVSQDFAQYSGSGDGIGLQTGSWDQTRLDLVSDITDIPVDDASFDAVMCIEVIEHLPDPVLALRELTRILRPGGSLILTAPVCSLTHFAPYFFHTGFSRYFYEHWLPELGFAIEDMQWNGNYFEYLAQELRRLDWASQTYAGIRLGYPTRAFIGRILALLDRLSRHDRGSEQLLAFGIQVSARKELPRTR